MIIKHEIAVHEAGHIIVGLHLGLREMGILFRPIRETEAAQSHYQMLSPETSLVRCMGGLLAQVLVLPETIENRLLKAYQTSIVFTPEHPQLNELTIGERHFLSGAQSDMALAYDFAKQISLKDSQSVIPLIKEAEIKARDLLKSSVKQIRILAEDIMAFGTEPEADDPEWVLYDLDRIRQNEHFLKFTSPST